MRVSICLTVCLSVWLFVCLSVCSLARLKLHVQTLLNFFARYLWPWRQWNTLCTSGFVDDVMFSHNGPCAICIT